MNHDSLDQIIADMMGSPDTRLSAETSNAINFCRRGHPRAAGKSEADRLATVRMAIVGRDVSATFRLRLDRLDRQQKDRT